MSDEKIDKKTVYMFIILAVICGTVSIAYMVWYRVHAPADVRLVVDLSVPSRPIPETLFGIFFQEINHAGSGGLWGERVSNRGFEAGGHDTLPNIDPWTIIGSDSAISITTDNSSLFEQNKVALRMNITCDSEGNNICPPGGVGVYNPGFWGMNIETGETYKLILYARSSDPINISVALTSSLGEETLANHNLIFDDAIANWTKIEVILKANSSNSQSRLQFTTTKKGVVWFDQVSLMPTNTYKGHGFRKDLIQKLLDLEPRFIRFPGGPFVGGLRQRNAFHWKQTVGPWENRPGHLNDAWMYWTDDGLGYFELLQLAEDVGVPSVWVVNCGISIQDEVETSDISPFVQDMLDSIEFANGNQSSHWGSLRAAMGHPESFNLKYVAIGNQDCGNQYYLGNYHKFYNALKKAYPDIQVISNCDSSLTQADLYDFHVYTDANEMSTTETNLLHNIPRDGSKVIVSEYSVIGKEAGNGNLLAALAEAAFLIGIEQNSDIVEMASYAQLLANSNDRFWVNDAIVFDSSRVYGTPSYWMQRFFTKSSGGSLLKTMIQGNKLVVASAVTWRNATDDKSYIIIKIVNLESTRIKLKLSIEFDEDHLKITGLKKTILTSAHITDENSFENPTQVSPVSSRFIMLKKAVDIKIEPYSFTSLLLELEQVDV